MLLGIAVSVSWLKVSYSWCLFLLESADTTLMMRNGKSSVTELESTHKEADNRIILHVMYCTHDENVERIIIYRSDTDGIVLAIYCAETLWNHDDELIL